MQSKARNTVIQPFNLNIISLGLFSLLYDVMEQEIGKARRTLVLLLGLLGALPAELF